MKVVSGLCFLLATTMAAAAPAAKTYNYQDVTVSDPQAISSGTWRYTLKRSIEPWACGSERCLEHVVTVANDSAQTLDCRLRVEYRRPDGTVGRSFEGPLLVLPRTNSDVHSMITDGVTQADLRFLDCRARTPYQRLPRTADCRYTMMGKPFESYYPPEAKRASQQGPVIVSFLLDRRQGTAKEVAIAESSQVPILDEAALRFIRDQEFVTTCPDRRYDILMRFKLRDEVLAQPVN
jgi:TonB family protein